MQQSLDMDRIARDLGATRRGTVEARGGYFGAMQLAAEVAARLRAPDSEQHSSDSTFNERRLVPFSTETLVQLDRLALEANASPMQVAAVLLEQAVRTAAGKPHQHA
jgi:hypothetical protein